MTSLQPMRWWHIEQVMPLEAELFGAEQWSREMLWNELAQHDTRHYVVAVEDDEVVGYAGFGMLGDEGSVLTIGVASAYQGRGVGSLLLGELLAEAERRGGPPVLLEVRADNERAQRLYERHGFRRIGVRRHYYQPSGQDAVVMKRG